MKNNVILYLAQLFNQASTNEVEVKDAYKILKWKSEISKAQEAIGEQQKAIVNECFADEEERRIAADAKAEKSPELLEKIGKFNQLFAELLEDETEVSIKTISFENWHTFCKENKLKLGMLECTLEGVFFEAVKED